MSGWRERAYRVAPAVLFGATMCAFDIPLWPEAAVLVLVASVCMAWELAIANRDFNRTLEALKERLLLEQAIDEALDDEIEDEESEEPWAGPRS